MGTIELTQSELGKRQQDLERFKKVLKLNKDRWVTTSIDETSVTHKYANIDLFQALRGLSFSYSELKQLEGRSSLGNIRLQFPMNAPGVAIGVAAGPAYLTGNNIEIRLSSAQQGLSQLVEELVAKAELKGVNVVNVPAKQYITETLNGGYQGLHVFGHDKNIAPWTPSITESISAGRLKVFASELTGKDFYVVMDDANVKKAAWEFLLAATLSSGQVCMSPEAAFVHESISDKFIDYLAKYTKYLHVGDPSHPKTDIGPLMTTGVYQNAVDCINDAIARGAIKKDTADFKYTADPNKMKNLLIPNYILKIKDKSSRALHEETFCPALLVVPFKYHDEVVEHMKSLEYGLTTSLYGKKSIRVLKDQLNGVIGIIFENEPFFKGFDVHKRGWGGFKNSGWVQYLGNNGQVETTHGPKHLPYLFSQNN